MRLPTHWVFARRVVRSLPREQQDNRPLVPNLQALLGRQELQDPAAEQQRKWRKPLTPRQLDCGHPLAPATKRLGLARNFPPLHRGT